MLKTLQICAQQDKLALASDQDGLTPLMLAAREGHRPMLQLLLKLTDKGKDDRLLSVDKSGAVLLLLVHSIHASACLCLWADLKHAWVGTMEMLAPRGCTYWPGLFMTLMTWRHQMCRHCVQELDAADSSMCTLCPLLQWQRATCAAQPCTCMWPCHVMLHLSRSLP